MKLEGRRQSKNIEVKPKGSKIYNHPAIGIMDVIPGKRARQQLNDIQSINRGKRMKFPQPKKKKK